MALPERHAWLSATVLLLAGLISVSVLSLQIRPNAEIVAVAFPPWWGTNDVFLAAASANAAIVRTTAIPSILVVRPDDRDGLTRLRDAGSLVRARSGSHRRLFYKK